MTLLIASMVALHVFTCSDSLIIQKYAVPHFTPPHTCSPIHPFLVTISPTNRNTNNILKSSTFPRLLVIIQSEKKKATSASSVLSCKAGPSPVAYSAQPQAISTNWGALHLYYRHTNMSRKAFISSSPLISTSHSPLLLELLHPYRISHLPHGFSHLILSAVPPVVPFHLPSCLLPCRAGHCRPVQTAPPNTP